MFSTKIANVIENISAPKILYAFRQNYSHYVNAWKMRYKVVVDCSLSPVSGDFELFRLEQVKCIWKCNKNKAASDLQH